MGAQVTTTTTTTTTNQQMKIDSTLIDSVKGIVRRFAGERPEEPQPTPPQPKPPYDRAEVRATYEALAQLTALEFIRKCSEQEWPDPMTEIAEDLNRRITDEIGETPAGPLLMGVGMLVATVVESLDSAGFERSGCLEIIHGTASLTMEATDKRKQHDTPPEEARV